MSDLNSKFDEIESLDEDIENIIDERKADDIREYFITKGCQNIFKYLTNVEVFDKKSASDSIIIFAKLKYNLKEYNIVLKITYKSKNPLNNSLEVEEQIYNNVVSNLLENKNTPHLITYISSIRNCDFNFSKFKFNSKINKKIEDFKEKNKNEYFLDNSTITILERTTGKTFADTITLTSTSNQLILIFQILYTLQCFNNITLRHNDLHLGNIFVENIKEETYHYNINNEIISIKQSLISKIYDFDRGSIYSPAVSRNLETDIEYCNYYRQCSKLNSKADLQSFIGSLVFFRVDLSDQVRDWLRTITSPEFRQIISERVFPQTAENENIPDKDLLSLSDCIKQLIKVMKKENLISTAKEDTKEEHYYELPSLYKKMEWNPIVKNTNILTAIKIGKDLKLTKIPDDIIIKLNSSFLFKEYYDEFLLFKYNILEEGFNLFKYLYTLKKVSNIKGYIQTCILMSIPFWYKLNNNEKSNLAFTIFESYWKDEESNVWNLFFNRLPIKMPLV